MVKRFLVCGRFTVQPFPKAWLARRRILQQKITVFIVVAGKSYSSPQVVGLTPSYQVVIMPHNLQIVDYVIRVPGSLHDSISFSHARIFRHPQAFLGTNEWIWADTAYPSLTWCIVPFKKPSGRELAADLKFFNYHLSSVSGMF